MKRKKKHHRGRSIGKRSSSMLGKIDTQNILMVALGSVGAKFIDKVIPDSVDPKITSIGKVVVGVALPMLGKEGKTKDILAGIGSGFIAVGTIETLQAFGVLSGAGDEDLMVVTLAGMDDLPVVNGQDDIPVVNGTESVIAGNDSEEVSVVAGMDEYSMEAN